MTHFPLRSFVLAVLGATACTQSPAPNMNEDMAAMPDMATAGGGMNCDDSAVAQDGADDPFYPQQWHLKNSGAGGVDLNIGTTWDSNRGDRVLVAVVDDGVEIRHEDLAINTKESGGLNFWNGMAGYAASMTDPTPTTQPTGGAPAHGTAVAGIIAGRDKNGLGVRGVAPRACVAGVNLIATGTNNSLQEAQAMKHRLAEMSVSNNSWGSTDGLGRTDGGSMEWANSIVDGITQGRGGKGIVYLWAAGNGAKTNEAMTSGFETDNSNYDGQANDPNVLSICGVMDDGHRVNYSERGANLWVCGFSQRTTYDTDNRGTVTTDISAMQGYNARMPAAGTGLMGNDFANGNYTQGFNGTSSATPTVAGVVALIVKENPNLGWRDVRMILAESATKNDASNADWQTNQGTRVSGAGGYNINHNYGFGLANVSAAIALAKTWTNLPARATSYDSGLRTPGSAFADNNTTGAMDAVAVTGSPITRIEAIEVILTATGDIGDLDVRLTGSGGTESRLAEPHDCFANAMSMTPQMCGQAYAGWRMSTNRHLGETANQTWTLRVSDRRTGRTSGGTLTSWQLKIHGRAG